MELGFGLVVEAASAGSSVKSFGDETTAARARREVLTSAAFSDAGVVGEG